MGIYLLCSLNDHICATWCSSTDMGSGMRSSRVLISASEIGHWKEAKNCSETSLS